MEMTLTQPLPATESGVSVISAPAASVTGAIIVVTWKGDSIGVPLGADDITSAIQTLVRVRAIVVDGAPAREM